MSSIIAKRQSLQKQVSEAVKENQKLARKIEKMESLANVGVVSAMVAHEINNILTPLNSYAELAKQNPKDEQLTLKAINKAVNNTARAAKILDSLMKMARGAGSEQKKCKVADIIDNALTCMGRDPKKDGIVLKIKVDPQLEIIADEVAFSQVIMNLVLNARDAMLSRKSGILKISSSRLADGHVAICVSDTGCGIREEDLDLIFEPFYTTKDDRQEKTKSGCGLGLAFCKKVVSAHNGKIEVATKTGHGTTFTITLGAAGSN